MYLPERKTNTQGNTVCSALTICSGLAHVHGCPWHSSPACFYLINQSTVTWEEDNSALIDWVNLTGFGIGTRRWVLFKANPQLQNAVLRHDAFPGLPSFGWVMCVGEMAGLGGRAWPQPLGGGACLFVKPAPRRLCMQTETGGLLSVTS